MRKRTERRGKSFRWVLWILSAAAVVQELRTPREEREWHGKVAGVVPYDFRFPSVERARARWWDPQGSMIQPQVFGVGWTLNFGRLVAMLRGDS